MAILAECPTCHKKQGAKNRLCSCGENLVKAKRSKRVKYWISYRLPDGRQKRESVDAYEDLNGYSIEDANKALSKRVVQKAEKRLMDVKPEFQTSFRELTEWYLDLESVKALASYKTIKVKLEKFNQEFGNKIVGTIKLADLENYQANLKKSGLKPKTIDDDISYVKTMIIKAFDNDMVGGDVLKAFKRIKRFLKGHANARDRVLTGQEYEALLSQSPKHLGDLLFIGYWTGMRKGEILGLTWEKVDLKERMIRLEDEDTKEGKAKSVPMAEELYRVLSKIPRPIHDDHVFLYNGKPIRNRFETALKRACSKAGIVWGREVKDGFIFHDLRHTFVTDMRRAGVPRTVTMAITGHAIKDMNQRYDTVDDQDKLTAIRQLESYRFANVDQSVDQATHPK
jgi:integrase